MNQSIFLCVGELSLIRRTGGIRMVCMEREFGELIRILAERVRILEQYHAELVRHRTELDRVLQAGEDIHAASLLQMIRHSIAVSEQEVRDLSIFVREIGTPDRPQPVISEIRSVLETMLDQSIEQAVMDEKARRLELERKADADLEALKSARDAGTQ